MTDDIVDMAGWRSEAEIVDAMNDNLASLLAAAVAQVARTYCGGQPVDWIERKTAVAVIVVTQMLERQAKPVLLQLPASLSDHDRADIIAAVATWGREHADSVREPFFRHLVDLIGP